jgi:hypothetical protein
VLNTRRSRCKGLVNGGIRDVNHDRDRAAAMI